MTIDAPKLIHRTYGYQRDYDISYSKEESESDSNMGGYLWIVLTEEQGDVQMTVDNESESISVIVPTSTRDSSLMEEDSTSILDEIEIEAYREKSWISLFGDSPAPEKYRGAVADCSGILDDIFPPDSQGDRILDKVLRDSED